VILASGAGAGYAFYGVTWVLGIVLGLFLYGKCSNRANENSSAAASRKTLLVFSFIPCGGLQMIVVLWMFAQYKIHMRGMASEGELKQRFDNASFGNSLSSTPPPAPAANNPFGSPPAQPGQTAPPKPTSDNPFM
jgi:hypothetical protein